MNWDSLIKRREYGDWKPTSDSLVRRVINNKNLSTQDRKAFLMDIADSDMHFAGMGRIFMVDTRSAVGDDRIYRISVFPDGVDIVCFGLDSVDSCLEGPYSDVDDLPNWVKERLAVLNMIPATPPTQQVDGVGRRISAHVYWVFAPDTSTDASTSA